MNERLKELMLQAGYAAPELAGRAQKLAELLLAEFDNLCVSEAEKYAALRKATMDFSEKNLYAEAEGAVERVRLTLKRRF